MSPIFLGHREAKKQPLNASLIVGTAPSNLICSVTAVGSGIGAAERSASVYGCEGPDRTDSALPYSAICPAYTTMISSEMYLTTPRSWVIKT